MTLTATLASGYPFLGWGGACTGAATTCTVTMDAAKSVSANFAVLPDTSSSTSTTTSTSNITATTTTAVSTSTTTVGSTTTTTLAGVSVPLATGWNLVGTGAGGTVSVASVLGDASKVTSVWKWLRDTARWAFYAPALDAQGGSALADYAANKGFAVLSTIDPGEGFWVNAKTVFTLPLPAGTAVSAESFQTTLVTGWNLVATGDKLTPAAFNNGLSVTSPQPGVTPINVITLWTWDSLLSNWYFFAPSKQADGSLPAYILSKGYLSFGAKTLDPAMGFWVNKP